MINVIDVSFACGGNAGDIVAAGVRKIIRYYSRDTSLPTKRLTAAEAAQFAAAGLRIAVVHEARHGDNIASFSRPLGSADAAYARQYASQVIGQPAGSAIYFAADFDPSSVEIAGSIIPYFQGVADAIAAPNGEPAYAVGVYSSGAACAALLDQNLVSLAWLSQSTGFAGYTDFLQSGRWTLKQGMPTNIGEVDCDPNTLNPNGVDIGDFVFSNASPNGNLILGSPMTVNARSGLRLRAGPSIQFDAIGLLPNGATVFPIKIVGDWTQVGLRADGVADGFASSVFLTA